MARPPQSKAAPGLFLRGQTFWLRYSVGGEQIRVSLDTSDRLEAIIRAEERRGQKQISAVTGKIRGGKTELDRTLERYTAERQRAKITDEKGFKDGTAKGVTQAVKHFQTVMGITDPSGITSKAVSEFYRQLNGTFLLPGNQVKLDTTHKKSEATARTYATRWPHLPDGLALRLQRSADQSVIAVGDNNKVARVTQRTTLLLEADCLLIDHGPV